MKSGSSSSDMFEDFEEEHKSELAIGKQLADFQKKGCRYHHCKFYMCWVSICTVGPGPSVSK